jgi:hypothetical protein
MVVRPWRCRPGLDSFYRVPPSPPQFPEPASGLGGIATAMDVANPISNLSRKAPNLGDSYVESLWCAVIDHDDPARCSSLADDGGGLVRPVLRSPPRRRQCRSQPIRPRVFRRRAVFWRRLSGVAGHGCSPTGTAGQASPGKVPVMRTGIPTRRPMIDPQGGARCSFLFQQCSS